MRTYHLLLVRSFTGSHAELFTIRKYDIHMFVKCNERSHKFTAVLDVDPNAILQPLLHSRILPRHNEWYSDDIATNVQKFYKTLPLHRFP